MGAELETHFTPFEAGLERRRTKSQDFIGKEAYLAASEQEPDAILCTLSVDDHISADGIARYMQGGEPITTADGQGIADKHGRTAYVTTAGASPSTGKFLLMAYLPRELAVEGNKLFVEYMTESYPVTIEVAGSRPYFDPENTRLKS